MAEKQSDPIVKIDDQLGEYEAKLAEELSKLGEMQRDVKTKLQRVKAMRRAGGERDGQKSSLPAPKKSDVLRLAASLLQDGPLPAEQLKKEIAGRLRETHKLAGFALRMNEALQSRSLKVDSDGLVQLVENSTKTAPTRAKGAVQ